MFQKMWECSISSYYGTQRGQKQHHWVSQSVYFYILITSNSSHYSYPCPEGYLKLVVTIMVSEMLP